MYNVEQRRFHRGYPDITKHCVKLSYPENKQFARWVNFACLLSSAVIFQYLLFRKILSGLPLEC